MMEPYTHLFYQNKLSCPADIKDFILEGQADITFPNGRMRVSSALPPELEQKANYVLWCPQSFPDGICMEWLFYPLSDIGLCMTFFAAVGRGSRDLFDPALPPRTGEYPQYNNGEIDTLHLAYYRRRYPEERAFRVCNLRKSKGAQLVAQAGDPLPPLTDAVSPYHMRLIKDARCVRFFINDMPVLSWTDPEPRYLSGGRIGFRQMSPMVAEYADFAVYTKNG